MSELTRQALVDLLERVRVETRAAHRWSYSSRNQDHGLDCACGQEFEHVVEYDGHLDALAHAAQVDAMLHTIARELFEKAIDRHAALRLRALTSEGTDRD